MRSLTSLLAPCLLVGAACSVPEKQPGGSVGDGGVDTPQPDADPTVPDTMITMAPDEFSRVPTAMFSFTSTFDDATFECSFDGETPVACTTPYTRSLNDGAHSFAVRAIAPSGRSDDTPAEHLWMIDTVAPQTTFVQVPPAADNSPTVQFQFTSNEDNVTFDCALDGGSFAVCESGATFGPLADGSHSFAVRAHDRAGNVDTSPAIHAWSIDTGTPDTQLLSGPAGATGSTTATFTFVSPDAGSGATFECRLDGGGFVACASPQGYAGLGEGVHTFAVRVRDAVGNLDPSPATRTWTVDLTPPDTAILSGPTGTVPMASATFTFSSNEADTTFVCSLDGGAFVACTSPHNLEALAQGDHTFAVRATDLAGHEDPTPATAMWTVDTTTPQVAITAGPPAGGESGPRVAFGFTANEGSTTCSVDAAAFAPCASPLAFNIAAGAHLFQVRAVDPAGNVATAARAWTVTCAAPGPEGAVAVLHLDDPGQVLANAVAGGASATLGSDELVEPADPTSVAGRFGNALAFTAGEGDHVAWPVALGMLAELTLELWARPDAVDGVRDLVVSGDGRIALRSVAETASTVRLAFTSLGAGDQPHTATSQPVAAGVWHHVIASLGDPAIRLWVDGIRSDATIQLAAAPALDALRLGGANGAAYSGALDEIWLAQRAIADDEAALARYCPVN